MANNALTEYSAKRTFAATPEPPPAVPAIGSGPLVAARTAPGGSGVAVNVRLAEYSVRLFFAMAGF